MLVAQRAQAGRAQEKESAGAWPKPQPTCRKDSQEVSAGKDQDVALKRLYLFEQAIGSRAHVSGGFSARATVTKQAPIRPFRPNFSAAAALIFTVIPFEQVRLNFSQASKASQFAGARSPLQWAGENPFEFEPVQPLPETARIALASFGQWQIRPPGVLSGDAPGSFAVTREIDGGKGFAHWIFSSGVFMFRKTRSGRS
jgi:hypothetical protein